MISEYPITPVPKPRQTRSDKWNVRPCVARYRAFADEVRLRGVTVLSGDSVTFVIPMPKSWSKKKRAQMNGKPHMAKPDVDNLGKACFDACHSDDSHIWKITLIKIWGESGSIRISRSTSSE